MVNGYEFIKWLKKNGFYEELSSVCFPEYGGIERALDSFSSQGHEERVQSALIRGYFNLLHDQMIDDEGYFQYNWAELSVLYLEQFVDTLFGIRCDIKERKLKNMFEELFEEMDENLYEDYFETEKLPIFKD